MRRRLAGHRPRTSTLVLVAVFVAALVSWLWVRPEPVKEQPKVGVVIQQPSPTPAARTGATPSATPSQPATPTSAPTTPPTGSTGTTGTTGTTGSPGPSGVPSGPAGSILPSGASPSPGSGAGQLPSGSGTSSSPAAP